MRFHQIPLGSSLSAERIMRPQLPVPGSTPTPMYVRTASDMTRPEKSRVISMTTRYMTFGRIWRKRRRASLAPRARAASTYSMLLHLQCLAPDEAAEAHPGGDARGRCRAARAPSP